MEKESSLPAVPDQPKTELDNLSALTKGLEARSFWSPSLEYPGFIALNAVPGITNGCHVVATPWFNEKDQLDIQVNDGHGCHIESIDSVKFPTQDSPLEVQVDAYIKALTEALPEILRLSGSSSNILWEDTTIGIKLCYESGEYVIYEGDVSLYLDMDQLEGYFKTLRSEVK